MVQQSHSYASHDTCCTNRSAVVGASPFCSLSEHPQCGWHSQTLAETRSIVWPTALSNDFG